jgi:hypothetical protein
VHDFLEIDEIEKLGLNDIIIQERKPVQHHPARSARIIVIQAGSVTIEPSVCAVVTPFPEIATVSEPARQKHDEKDDQEVRKNDEKTVCHV